MTYVKHPASTWGLDAHPIDAACVVDLVRGNYDHLMRQSPASCSMLWVNGAPTSTANAYNDASVVWRSPMCWLRAGMDRAYRNVACRIGAYMNSGTGSVRVCASPWWRVVAAAAPFNGDVVQASAAGAIVSTTAADPTWVTLALALPAFHPVPTQYGTAHALRAATIYGGAFFSLQAIAAATKTITVVGFTIAEVDP